MTTTKYSLRSSFSTIPYYSVLNLERHLLYHLLEVEPCKRPGAYEKRIEMERKLNDALKQTANNNVEQTCIPISIPLETRPEPPKIQMSKCKYCQKEVRTRLLVTHVHQEHKQELMNWPPILQRKQKKIFKCSECDKTYLRRHLLVKHARSHIPKFKCEHCEKAFFKKSILDRHLVKVHNIRRKSLCYICGKIISSTNMYIHIRTHTYKKLYRCSVKGCNVVLKYHSSITDHVRRAHMERKSFICEHCGKQFAARANLRLHLMTHEQGFKLLCNVCGKGFYVVSQLKKHLISHQQEKCYRCPLCPQVFTYKQSIRKHCIIFHPNHPFAANPPDYLYKKRNASDNSVEKRFKCSICSRRFFYEHSIKMHNKRFHPFSL